MYTYKRELILLILILHIYVLNQLYNQTMGACSSNECYGGYCYFEELNRQVLQISKWYA